MGPLEAMILPMSTPLRGSCDLEVYAAAETVAAVNDDDDADVIADAAADDGSVVCLLMMICLYLPKISC